MISNLTSAQRHAQANVLGGGLQALIGVNDLEGQKRSIRQAIECGIRVGKRGFGEAFTFHYMPLCCALCVLAYGG